MRFGVTLPAYEHKKGGKMRRIIITGVSLFVFATITTRVASAARATQS